MEKLVSMLTCNNQKAKSEHISEVLIWGDFDNAILSRLCKKLDSKYKFTLISRPVELLRRYDLDTVHAIILINTDVSKLSASDGLIKEIDEYLNNFVKSGGLLLGTHDIIYRRTRNVCLQGAFGYQVNNFARVDNVKYNKTEKCKELNVFSSLDNIFSLADGEVCWGEKLRPDVTVYFTCNNDELSIKNKPLVFSRQHGDGICFWFNTGDFKDDPPTSIITAENSLVQLINEALNWKNWKSNSS
jgi:glycerophosphoryl diester phosphodiesterase